MTISMSSGHDNFNKAHMDFKAMSEDAILSPLTAEHMQAVAMTDGGTCTKSGSEKNKTTEKKN